MEVRAVGRPLGPWAWGIASVVLFASCAGEGPVDTLATSPRSAEPDADHPADTVVTDTLTTLDEPALPPLSGTVAFSADRPGSRGPYIYLAFADGSNVTPLTSGRRPAWSPDGGKLAFQRRSDDEDHSAGIYVVDADGSNETWLVDGFDPAWSPDGSRIVFSGPDGIMIMTADGTDVSVVLREEDHWEPDTYGWAGLMDPAWSPDGRQIVFTRGGEGTGAVYATPPQLYVVNADGSDLRLLSSPSGCGRLLGAWSPDGSEIAFLECGSVVVARTDGSDEQVVTEGAWPAWSPDGRYLTFATGSDRYAIDPDGGPTYLLIPNGVATDSGPLSWTAREVRSRPDP